VSDEKKILIIEDDTDLAEMLTAYFRVQGFKVTTAGWGEDAVQMAAEEAPDIVVLDIRLPDIDGYEVCRRLRQNRLTRNIPIVFLTEKRERDDKLSGLELGAVDYITKPFDIQELRLRVRNVMRRFGLQTLVNPVTGLPEGHVVQERLEEMLKKGEWSLVFAGLRGLNRFRDRYGFVAADDVTRAVGLMLSNALQDSGAELDFVGHIDSADFVILTTPERSKRLTENCLLRLQPSIQYFYPAIDRTQLDQWPDSERLAVQVTTLSSRDGTFSSVAELRTALNTNLE
jgi:PleD family two-component response regulator